MSERVSITITNGVADVRMTRPDKMNALDPAMFAALAEAGEQLKTEPGVRVVVLSGEGRAFCAGLDMGSMAAMAGSGPRDTSTASVSAIAEGRITHLGQQVCWVWQELPVPVIAAVHGVALGGGIQLALGADIRIVSPDVKMSVLEVKWGLVPDMAGTHRLAQLVRADIALELAATGRMVDGNEAVRIGLATHVSETPYEDAHALAGQIAGRSPHAVRGVKELVRAAFAGADAATQFASERRIIGGLIGTANQVESVKAGFEKREAIFTEV